MHIEHTSSLSLFLFFSVYVSLLICLMGVVLNSVARLESHSTFLHIILVIACKLLPTLATQIHSILGEVTHFDS